MKKSVILLASLALMFIFSACGGDNSPKGVAETYCEAVIDGDIETVFDMMEGSDKATDEEKAFWIGMARDKFSKQAEAKGGFDKFEVLSEEIAEDGQTAKVKVKFTFKDGSDKEETVRLILIDGDWKLKK